MLTLLTGATAGLFHVLSGPDHLAAVAPIAISDRERGWVAGWTWGVGHTAGVVTVALLAVLLRDFLPALEILSAWSERLVGAALVGIGFWAFRRSVRMQSGAHVHGMTPHAHLHIQRGPRWVRRLGHAHASFCLGVLHGIAGSSHFFGVLPALALPTTAAALTYVAAFGVGTIAAMTAFAAAVAAAGIRVRPGAVAHRMMMRVAAVAAIVVGGVWLTGVWAG